jgi:hypothetical protein
MIKTLRDFETATETDRFVLETGALETPAVGGGLDLRQSGNTIALMMSANMSAGAIEETVARFRPMLFAVAWRVLDLMIELGLNQAVPTPPAEWTIAEKQKYAKAGTGRLLPFSSDTDVWPRMCSVYAETVEARHCLIHRTYHRGPKGDLTGLVDRKGVAVKNVTTDEQVAMISLVRRAAPALVASHLSNRERDDVLFHLDRLAAHHGLQVLGNSELGAIVNVIVDGVPVADGNWEINVSSALGRARAVFLAADHFDVEIHFPGFAREPLRGELESAPQGVQVIDPSAPPSWLA